MNKSPAFQFYPSDFLSDENVVLMNNREIGCYIKLLSHCWLEGSIPKEIEKLARLCGESTDVMWDIWERLDACFNENGKTGRLINPRLERERLKQEEYRKGQSESGKRGMESRWGKTSNNKPIASQLPPVITNHNSSSSSSISSSNINTPPLPPSRGNDYSDSFNQFWKAYPKRIGKGAAWRSWKKVKAMKEIMPNLMKALEKQKKSDQWAKENGQFVPNPSTWLNQRRWEDEGFIPSSASDYKCKCCSKTVSFLYSTGLCKECAKFPGD